MFSIPISCLQFPKIIYSLKIQSFFDGDPTFDLLAVGSSGSATDDWSDTMPSSLSWQWESCSKASASVRLATACEEEEAVGVAVARLLWRPEGGLGCCPRGVHEEPSEEAPDVEDMGEDDPSWIGGEAAEA